MKYILVTLFLTLYLDAQLLTPTIRPQFGSGRATYNNNAGFIQPMIPNRMMPYAAGVQNQKQNQQPNQPLRAHNNRYPVNKSNIMGFGGYERMNLRNNKAQAIATQRYKTTLATLRINLRGYRMNFGKPITPTTNNNNNGNATTQPPTPTQPPIPTPPTPAPPTNNNGQGQVGIGGGPGPVPPSFPGGPVAIGMPAPQPR